MATENPNSDRGLGLKVGPSEPTEDVKTFDEDALADKIKTGFAAAFGDEDPAEDPADDPAEDDDYDFADEAEDDEEQDEEPDGSAEDEDEPDTDDSNVVDEPEVSAAPTIPQAHERSLLANHTRDEIKQLRKNLGKEGFADYAARAHEKRNAETAQMAMFGRLAKDLGQGNRQGPEAAANQPHQPTQTKPLGGAPTKLEPVSVEALREKFGDDELIDTFASQMNAQAAVLNQMLQQQEQQSQSLRQQANEALARQVDEFFAGPEVADLKGHYGANSSALTPEQEHARVKVLEMADALVAGSQFQGQPLSVQEALSRAHAALSVEVSEAAVRNKIKKQAKQRNRGISLRPSRGSGASADLSRKGTPRTESELQARTRSRMKAVFG